MSIHIILGKPGSGKSFYATRRLIDELCDTARNIVTNLPLRLDALNEYVQKRWPDRDLRALQRIRLLSDSEMRYFWKFRSQEDVAPETLATWEAETNEARKASLARELDAWAKTPTTSDAGRGVAYYLDEAHIPFNARAWASIASAALFYLSQHRKLGDIVWPITQAPSNLDKQFRSVAEDFTRVRNEYTAKFGVFKGRGRFVRKTYLSEPNGSNDEPFETATFSLDGVETCYDTARGIGVHGNKADIGRRAKGIPIMWVVPGALALALACVAIPWAMGKGAQKFIGGTKAAEARVAPQATPQTQTVATAAAAVPPPAPAITPRVQDAGVYVRGYAVRGDRINVVMSDGRTLTEKDPELRSVERNSAVVEGQKVFLRVESRAVTQTVVNAKQSTFAPPSQPARRSEPEAKTSSSANLGEALFAPSDTITRVVSTSQSSQSPPRAGTGRR